jgi:predicted dehydrogenase
MAMAAGKSVYVEKPVALDVAGAKRMQAVELETVGKLAVAHYRRALPMFMAIKKIVETGLLGNIQLVNLQYLQPALDNLTLTPKDLWRVDPALAGAGLFYDIAPHQIDILIDLFGKPVKYGGKSIKQLKSNPVEDTVTGWINFDKDILFTGTWGFSMRRDMQRDRCEMIGDKGSLTFNFFGNEGILKMSDGSEQLFVQPVHIQQPMIEQVVQFFLGKRNNPCSIEDALLSLEVMQNFVYQC